MMTASDPTDLPQFNPTALQNLTQQIQRNIAESKSKGAKAARNAAAKSKKKSEQIVQNGVRDTHREGQKNTDTAGPTTVETKDRPKKEERRQDHTQSNGKKRLRNGDIKDPRDTSSSRPDAKRNGMKQRVSGSAAGGLREEILALGGDAEDFEQLQGLQSDEETVGPNEKHVEGGLLKDLKGFVKGLGLEKARGAFDAKVSDEDDQEGATAAGESSMPLAPPRPIDLKSAGKLVLQPLSEWHSAELSSLPTPSATQKAAPVEMVQRFHGHAKLLLEQENQAYAATQNSASSSHQFYSTIMSTGTLSDKISALTLSVQESPLHNMKALEQLMALAKKKSRAQAVDVLGALKDLFGAGSLIPSDRKLTTFAAQPQLHAALAATGASWAAGKPLPRPLNEAHLIFWAFEDWLKSIFFQTLQILESWSNDEVVFARGRAVDYIFTLLKDKPEQEQNLLRLLVNKLGDRDKKIASKTSYRILQLMTAHPAMKPTIIDAIESDILFRPHQGLHAQYYGTITLNQTVLSNGEVDVAKKLISVYFALFLKLLSKPEEKRKQETQLAKEQPVRLNRKGEVQGGGISIPGKAARKKEEALAKAKLEDAQLKEKMVAAVLTGVNRAIPYVSTDDESFDQHLDTLFRITHSSNFNTSIQALMLIQQIQGQSQITADRFYRTLYESLLDPRLLTSSKQVLYLNLLYRALRADLNIERIKAFTKRITQILSLHNAPFACAAIYLIRELESTFPSLSPFISGPEPEESDDEEETFKDVPEDGESDSGGASLMPASQHSDPVTTTQQAYDPRKRDPTHAKAANSSLWDLLPMALHYHPSVSLFASKLMSHASADSMPPKPDLNLNTLIHFLDRFVNKNPKQKLRGKSVMQPLAHVESDGPKGAVLVGKVGPSGKEGSVMVAADEVVFQRYFDATNGRAEKKREKKRRKMAEEEAPEIGDLGEDDEDEAMEDEGEDEDEVWNALVKSMPDVEGDGDEDDESDIDFSGEDLDDLLDDEEMSDGEGDGLDSSGGEKKIQAEDGDDDFPDFGSEDEDNIIDSDGEVELTNEADDALGTGRSQGRKAHKKKLRSLPTFASVEDYEDLMLQGEGDEI